MVFRLKLSKALSLIHLHAGKLAMPVIKTAIRDVQIAANVFNFGPSLVFLDCLNDLFVCVPVLHFEISILLD
jgi:hypothetical protein